jgi:hypothetical protein
MMIEILIYLTIVATVGVVIWVGTELNPGERCEDCGRRLYDCECDE